MSSFRLRCAWLGVLAFTASPAWSQSVTTYHYDNNRTGWNSNETSLTPASVSSSYFGPLRTVPLDDQVDSQPLYMPGVNITAGAFQGTHDVVYVATENNTVYAIDAESGTVLLNPNFGTPVARPLGCMNNGPNVGITSTPVIDPESNTLYVMVYTLQGTGPAYYLHALDLGSLTDKVPPQQVTASHMLADGSTFNFNATYQRQRPALLLANGNIYAGFGSFCDYAPNLSRGWLLGWQGGTLTPLAANHVFNTQVTSPRNFFLSSIWMAGYGPSADDWGNVLVVTGNSDPSGTTYDGVTNLQESVIKMSPDLSSVLDLFTPSNWATLDQRDNDFGSGGVLVLPDQLGSYPRLAVAAGKQGLLFLMNEDALGGYSSQTNNVFGTYNVGPCWCGQSYFVDPNDSLARVVSSGGRIAEVWKVQPSMIPSLTQVAASPLIAGGQDPGFFTTVSSNGTSSPIIWAISRPSSSDLSVYLYAFDPESGKTMTTLFRGAAGSWPNLGGDANLVPVVANGMVFVASHNQLQIFGLSAFPTTTTLTTSANPVASGQPVTFTASVQSPSNDDTPSGTVTFNDGATTLGSTTLAGGGASFTTSALVGGTHSITAAYGGDSEFAASTSAALAETVGPMSTTLNLAASLSTSQFQQPVVFTATASSASGATPTGTVVFADGGNTLGSFPLVSGTAALSVTKLSVGTHSITAVYGGSAGFAGSTSAAAAVTVGPASTTTTLTSNANPSNAGQAVALTATVIAAYGGSPSALVTFVDGTTVLGSVAPNATTHQATLTVSTLAAGTQSITANFVGGTNFATSSSQVLTQTVNPVAPANTTTNLATSLSTPQYQQPVVFTATVNSASGGTPTGSVIFSDGGNTLGTLNLNSGTAALTVTKLSVGNHSITAVYNGNAGFNSSSSSAAGVTVTAASTTTTLASTPNPANGGQAVTLTATVTGAYGGATTAPVTFLDGSTVLGSAAVNGTTHQSTLTVSTLAAGTHNLAANFLGGTNFAPSSSSVLSQTVNAVTPVSTTTNLSASLSTSQLQQPVVFTATVTSATGATPTGAVVFSDGANTLGSANLISGTATFSVTKLAVGLHSITAAYSGNVAFSNSSSAPTGVTVTQATTTTTLTSSPNPSIGGQSVTLTATVAPAYGGSPSAPVTFVDGTTVIGTVATNSTTHQATLVVSFSSGTHNITANFVGGTNFAPSSSQVLTQTVN